MLIFFTSNCDLGLEYGNQCLVHGTPYYDPYPSVNKVCFGTFQSNCRDVI